MTNIPYHLEFIRNRKRQHPDDFAQVVRLAKFWVRNVKQEQEDFRFKSFMVELALAHLADRGLSFADYPEALQHLFTYLATSDLRKQILFTDYYKAETVGEFSDRV